MNRNFAAMWLVVLLLAGVVLYLLGERNSTMPDNDGPLPEPEMPAAQETKGPSEAELAAERAKLKRAVRVGNDGPYESACRGLGSVANLPGGNDNFLSVREGPTVKAAQTDRLGDDAPVYLCDQNEDGSWIGVVYDPTGYVPITDECRVEELVPSRRTYEGPCLSGWVSAKYIEVRTQG